MIHFFIVNLAVPVRPAPSTVLLDPFKLPVMFSTRGMVVVSGRQKTTLLRAIICAVQHLPHWTIVTAKQVEQLHSICLATMPNEHIVWIARAHSCKFSPITVAPFR
jgi:hypothetical protein